jgi:hypothetical protein
MALSKPYKKANLSLSFDAALALAYGLRAIGTASPQRPHESSITRRALGLYASFLSGMAPEQLHDEARAVAASSNAFGLPAEEQEAAFGRLGAINVSRPLPGLLAVRNGSSAHLDSVALGVKVGESVQEMRRSRTTGKAVAS